MSDLSGAHVPLSAEEYERRKAFLAELQGLSKTEYVEILRILKQHDSMVSENHNGVFFNLCTITQEAFEALCLFRRFTLQNKEHLQDRERVMSSLTTAIAAENKGPK